MYRSSTRRPVLVNRSARGRTVVRILITWVTTLPLGFLLGAGIYLLLAA